MAPENLPARLALAEGRSTSAVVHVRERGAQRDWWVMLRAGVIAGASGNPDLAINIWHDITVQRREEVHARYLAEATAALGSSLIRDEMVGALARLFVPGMADWCAIHLLDGERVREAAVADTPALLTAVRQYRQAYAPRSDYAGGVWGVIRSGVSAALYPSGAEAPPGGRSSGAALIVPLRAQNRILGAIELVYVRDRGRYDASDMVLLEALGRRAGAALENAQLYKAAQHAARQAEEASRAKDEFLAIVSHELRTPLSAILGWSTLLKSRVTDAALTKPLEVIHRNAEAQVRIIDDILDVSRVITGKFRLDPKPMDLVAVARDALEVVRPSADAKKIRLEFAPNSEFCLLVADAERIQQVIWNLLSNAVKFSDPNGRVRLSVEQQGSQLVLAVEDDGRGIDPGFLPFVFDRFKQADSSLTRRVGGLGLGLALVRHIVELHGGRVAAASAGPGQGSRFTISLPMHDLVPLPPPAPRAADAEARPAPMAALPPLTGIKVLVIDDELDARELIAAVLVEAGAIVETAESTSAAFNTFQRFHPDVLVSDIGMPGEDGYSLIRRIRGLPATEGGRLPALALTAFAREEDRTRSLSAGFTTHIGKPVDPEALASAVANLAAIRHRS